MSSASNETFQLIILILVAIALLLQAGLVVVVLVGLGKLTKMAKEEIADIRQSVMPVVNETRDLLTNVAPKIEAAVDDLSTIIHTARSQSQAVGSASVEFVERFRRQAARLEGLMSGLIDTADRTSTVVAGVGGPIRRIAGVVASAKAVVDTLRGVNPRAQTSRARDRRDMAV